MKYLILSVFLFVGCSGFKAQRVSSDESDEKGLEITNNWLQKDTENVVADVLEQIKTHTKFQKYLACNSHE